MQIFVNYKNSSYIFCWFAHVVTEARLVIKNKSVLLWDLNSISSELFKLIVYCIDTKKTALSRCCRPRIAVYGLCTLVSLSLKKALSCSKVTYEFKVLFEEASDIQQG